jgi:hypothetical protein
MGDSSEVRTTLPGVFCNHQVRAIQVQCSTNDAGVAKTENIFFEFVGD